VELEGQYLTNKQILMRGQYKKNERVILYGFYVFTPFEYITNTGTKTIMIERGFITDDLEKTPKLYQKLASAKTTINGHVKTAELPGSFLPENTLENEIWYWRDIAAMATKFQLTNAQDFYISLSENPNQAFPKVSKIEIKSANNHLSYLITWFALAAGLLILYIYMHIYNGRLYLTKNKPTQFDETNI
ncbi:MAG: SURF1 family protein, partial [Rhizobiales bacterium]|nr:SURF1 family protein [Hyphomicrobiales bacterium]